MTDPQMALGLHEKVSLGQALSPEEQSLLDDWYALQDGTEQAHVRYPTAPPSLDVLRQKIEASLAELVLLSGKIQQFHAQNENLRSENARLQHQLIQQRSRKSA